MHQNASSCINNERFFFLFGFIFSVVIKEQKFPSDSFFKVVNQGYIIYFVINL